MGHYILPEAGDSDYEAVMNGILKRLSPYAEDPITPDRIPYSFIDDPIYIVPAERQVLVHNKLPFQPVSDDHPDHDLLVVLAQIRVCYEITIQSPQQLREMAVEQYGVYSEVKMQERIDFILESYARTLNPSTDVPTPGGHKPSGTLAPYVVLTDSRLDG